MATTTVITTIGSPNTVTTTTTPAPTVTTQANDSVIVNSPAASAATVATSTSSSSVITAPGNIGPQGPQGTTTGADANFVFTQVSAASVWTITHNLGKLPSVTVIDSGNDQVIGAVNYIDNNTVQLNFSAAFGGKATLN